MSESIKRRNSSRQLLQNLIRVTAQRNLEDAEEVERERRRRARMRLRGDRTPSSPESPQHSELTHGSPVWDEELKPSCRLVVEEDEGFSDWSHRLDKSQEQEAQDVCRAREQRASAAQRKPRHEDRERWESQRSTDSRGEVMPEKVRHDKKEIKMSYSSTVFLPQDVAPRPPPRPSDRTPHLVAEKMKQQGICRADGRLEQEEEEEEFVSLQNVSKEFEQSPEQEEEERRLTRGGTGDLWGPRREETFLETGEAQEAGRLPEKRSTEDRQGRDEEICMSGSGEELTSSYGPMSPTFKKLLIQFYPEEANSRNTAECTIIERTESLRKSTNSIKKTSPPLCVSKIDKRLEQYTHAIELSSKDGRSTQAPVDLMSPTEPVAAKKNLFEGREGLNQPSSTTSPSKDADGLKVGVAELINQWVKGSEDGSRGSSPSKPADRSSGKRYTFVVTGHGKYEKVDEEKRCGEYSRCQSGGPYHDEL